MTDVNIIYIMYLIKTCMLLHCLRKPSKYLQCKAGTCDVVKKSFIIDNVDVTIQVKGEHCHVLNTCTQIIPPVHESGMVA